MKMKMQVTSFENASDQPAFQTRTGMVMSDIASQARERYLSIVPKEGETVPPSWDDADQDEKAHWITACEGLVEFLGEEIESSFQDLAEKFARVYHGLDKWGSLKKPLRLANEVAVRHIVNMVTAEDDADLHDAINYDWKEWAIPRMEKT